MHKAKAFFFVCAGLLLLALSYHFGARSATAQNSSLVAMIDDGYGYNVLVGRAIQHLSRNGGRCTSPDVPGSSPVVAIYARGECGAFSPTYSAGLENGDLYEYPLASNQFVWHYVGNVFGTPTPAQRESFGALKSRYRGERGAEQTTRQDR